jgi:ectonucleoside triphosphate diphosphohydrolase 4
MARMEWKLKTLMLLIFGVGMFVVILYLLSDGYGSYGSYVEAVDRDYSYGIIIDAGSTGSRLFLYRWWSPSVKELIKIEPVLDENRQAIVRKVSPGLSTFGTKPEDASAYIRPLLDYAYRYIPSNKRDTASFFLFATAGMRLLPFDQQEAVVKSLREGLPKMTKIKIVPENVQIIDGKWEGIYNWIAVNYILGRFEPREDVNTALPKRKPTVGMIDMGGASTQIAFEIPLSDFQSENVQSVNLGSLEDTDDLRYQLFVTTFLGFGVNEGAKKYEKYLNSLVENSTDDISYVRDGCLPVNLMKIVSKDDGSQYVRKGTGEWDNCVKSIAKILTDGPPKCPLTKQCFFGGILSPPVRLSQIELYGFSEYWYSVEDVLSLGGAYNHSTFEERAKEFCQQRWSSIKSKARAQLYPKANDERLETQCFKSAWIHAILHDGFFVDENQHKFQSANKISEQEVQWALGAMIYHMRYSPVELGVSSSTRYSTPFIQGIVLFAVIVLIIFIAYYIYSRFYNKTIRRDRGGFNYQRLPNLNDVEFAEKMPRSARSYVSFFQK